MATSIGSGSSIEFPCNQPNQPISFTFPKKLGVKSPVFHSFQPLRYKRWLWIHYNQSLLFHLLGMLKAWASKGDDEFLSRGYSNWKDAGGKSDGFTSHEHSNVHKYSINIVSKAL